MKTNNCIKSILLTSLSFILLFYLSGCAGTKQDLVDSGMKQMTTQELKSLFSEKKLAKVLNVKKNKWYTMTYLPDGSVSTERKGRVRSSIYYIKKKEICTKKRSTSRKKRCSSWFKIDEDTYRAFNRDGSMAAKLIFQ